MAISANVMQLEKGKFKESTSSSGQPGVVVLNPDGSNITSSIVSGVVDDTASNFTIGTTRVTPSGFLADETGTDSVAEDRVGVARMTLDRRQINASEYAEDSVFANASYLTLVGAEADDPTALAAMTEGDVANFKTDLSGRLIVTLGTELAGEDLTLDLIKVEQRFSYTASMSADTQVKASAGFLHALTFACGDAAPTAGTIIVYDNTAESGTVVFDHEFTTTPFVPFTVILDVTMTTGIYIGFTTTADVNVTPSWR